MKEEYDFSKAERGKFYQPNALFNFPIYLEPDVYEYINRLAEEKGMDMQVVVNEWLRMNIKLIKSVEHFA